MSAIYVPLPRPVRDALTALAWRELRDPRLQARLLVEEGLRRAGALDEAAGTPNQLQEGAHVAYG